MFGMIADCSLINAELLLRENGGRIVTDIRDPALTHVVMDDEDSTRYAELSRKTSKYAFIPLQGLLLISGQSGNILFFHPGSKSASMKRH